MKGFFLNESTEHKDLTSTAIVTDDKRIANHNLIRNEAIDTKPYEFNKNRESLYYHSTKLVNAQGRPYKIANDPLILDLNGDGVKTASYTEKPVLFFC
ncbi:hypothetical protein GVX81_11195 [[Haemophilus] felis]|uniref:Uncharacterized protein n=1 Tax=[Haemophilus] felis TaxID=123822 RepID=A0A1T0AR98_9PAST|nr:hypothetical protein [[Haemophilus] felis]NBI41857.1 hypothetical protein [[Haemophilus] felis]OOR98526.1 hypothetical protein B0188_11350 [[Haemophilus] felis]